MDTQRKRRMQQEMLERTPKLRKLKRFLIIAVIFAFSVLVTLVVLGITLKKPALLAAGFIAFGSIFTLSMLGAVFSFLVSFSLGNLDAGDLTPDDEGNPILAETRMTLDMIESVKNAPKVKHQKLLVYLIYGWIFLCFISVPAGAGLDSFLNDGKPLYMFIGFGLFGGTILCLIFFGAVIPSIIRKHKIKAVTENCFSTDVTAAVKYTRLLSSSTMGSSVTENFLVVFDTPYGESRSQYKIKNIGHGDTQADGKRFNPGDKVLITITPREPKYCVIKEKVKDGTEREKIL